MSTDLNREDKPKIQINRKMRQWNKYKSYIIGGAVILVAVIVMALVFKSCGKGKGEAPDSNSTSTGSDISQNASQPASTDSSTGSVPQPTTQEITTQEPTTQEPTVAGGSVEISESAAKQEYTSRDSYSDAVFLGDMIVNGITSYGYLDSSHVVSNNNMTSDKAMDYVSQVAAKNPSKIYIMVGLNDFNYGTRKAEHVQGYLESLIGALKESSPSADIYILSVLPITKGFEARAAVNIKQSDIDELNAALGEKASSLGVTYINVANAFKDGTGYLGSEYTDSGYNIRSDYYPFILNAIAGVTK